MDTHDTGNKYLLPIAVVIGGLLIGGAVIWNARSSGTGPSQGAAIDASAIKTTNTPFLGKADAPVTIYEWADFQCPYCKQFEVTTFPQIKEKYVDTGKVKFVFMDFAFLGNDSTDAALYSRAVWKLYPERYGTWRAAMYEAQDAEGDQGFGDAASIDALNAKIAGIDAAKVAADVQANRDAYRTQIDADKNEGRKIGIKSTPSFVVGNTLVAGAYPYATFEAAIEELLQ